MRTWLYQLGALILAGTAWTQTKPSPPTPTLTNYISGTRTAFSGLQADSLTGKSKITICGHVTPLEGQWLPAGSPFGSGSGNLVADALNTNVGMTCFDVQPPWSALTASSQYQTICLANSDTCVASDCPGGQHCTELAALDTSFTHFHNQGYTLRLQAVGGGDRSIPGLCGLTKGSITQAQWKACTAPMLAAGAQRWASYISGMTVVQEPPCGQYLNTGEVFTVSDLHTYLANTITEIRSVNGSVPLGWTGAGPSCGWVNAYTSAGSELNVQNNQTAFTVVAGPNLRSYMVGQTWQVGGVTVTLGAITDTTHGSFSSPYTGTTSATATWAMQWDSVYVADATDSTQWSGGIPFAYYNLDHFESSCTPTQYQLDQEQIWLPYWITPMLATGKQVNIGQAVFPFWCPNTGTDSSTGQPWNNEPFESNSYSGTGNQIWGQNGLQAEWVWTLAGYASAKGLTSISLWCPMWLLSQSTQAVGTDTGSGDTDNCADGPYPGNTIAAFASWPSVDAARIKPLVLWPAQWVENGAVSNGKIGP